MKNSLDAVQSRLEVRLREQRVATDRAAGTPASKAGSGVGHEIGLARRISPASAGNQLALRRVVVESLPRTLALAEAGEVSGWAAEEVARAVIVLDDDERSAVDAEIAPRLPELTARGAGRVARGIADRLNAEAAVARIRRNTAQRTVTQRAAGEDMMRLSALLPTHEGVAAYAALAQAANMAKATGDARSRGGIMADTLVQRVTGMQEEDVVPVEIQLLMTDTALLGSGTDVALIDGHPIPGPIARNLALTGSLVPEYMQAQPAEPQGDQNDWGAQGGDSAARQASGPPASRVPAHPDAAQRRWIRRLYTDPVTGDLAAIDARRRVFSGHVRAFVTARDQRCRGPWCDAPIRHVHHVQGYVDGGATTPANGVGTCERLNHVAELPGWSTRIVSDSETARTEMTLTTPTGHTYRSRPPHLRAELCAEPQVPPDDDSPPEETWMPPDHLIEEWFIPEELDHGRGPGAVLITGAVPRPAVPSARSDRRR